MSEPERSPYIVGPVYDWFFFLSPPVVALALGFVISKSAFACVAHVARLVGE